MGLRAALFQRAIAASRALFYQRPRIKGILMTEINLDTLSLAELKQLEKALTKAITSFEERSKAAARAG